LFGLSLPSHFIFVWVRLTFACILLTTELDSVPSFLRTLHSFNSHQLFSFPTPILLGKMKSTLFITAASLASLVTASPVKRSAGNPYTANGVKAGLSGFQGIAENYPHAFKHLAVSTSRSVASFDVSRLAAFRFISAVYP
jgi:hypothetical protein